MAPRRAFTLVELLIIIVIIVVLANIAVPNPGGHSRHSSSWRRCLGEMKTLAGALEMHALDKGIAPLPLGPECIEPLKAGNYIPKEFGSQHAGPFPYVMLPGPEEMACVEHGLQGGKTWLSPREQLEDRGIADAALLARMSTSAVSAQARSDRDRMRALKAFGVAAVVWVVLAICQVAARWAEGKPADDPASTFIGVAVSAGLGVAAFVLLGIQEREGGFRMRAPVAPAPVRPVVASSLPAPAPVAPPRAPDTSPPRPAPPRREPRSAESIRKLVRVLVTAGLVGDAFDDEIIRALRDDHPDVSSAAFFAVIRLKERLGEGAYKKVEQKLTAVVAVKVLHGALRGKVSMPEYRSAAVEEALKELASSSNERLAAEARKFAR